MKEENDKFMSFIESSEILEDELLEEESGEKVSDEKNNIVDTRSIGIMVDLDSSMCDKNISETTIPKKVSSDSFVNVERDSTTFFS